MTITANSPMATSATEIQNGKPRNFQSSNPTINALDTTGNKQAIPKFFINIMPKQAIKVANEPKPTSTNPIAEGRLAIAQPMTKPKA